MNILQEARLFFTRSPAAGPISQASAAQCFRSKARLFFTRNCARRLASRPGCSRRLRSTARLHAICGKSSGNPDGCPAISFGYRRPPARIPDRCRSCGDDTRRAVGAGMPVGYRRSGPGGTSMVRMPAGRSGNNGKDAAKLDSSETGLRIDLLRRPDRRADLLRFRISLRI